VAQFNEFALDDQILKAVEANGFKDATAIQEQAIPPVLEGRDLIASAQTGTGKTAAFMLPMLHMILNTPPEKGIRPKALVLVPTRELAMQVTEESKKFSKFLPQIKTVCIYGGVPYPLQKRFLSSKYDILVATPGRLIDQIQQKRVDLSGIRMLVLDEADRMLDMGFVDAVDKIASSCPKVRQTLLFSATIDRKILPMSKRLQNDPIEIRIAPHQTSNVNIEQQLYYVDNISHKLQILEHLLQNGDITQTIVFTSTKMQADELARQLHEQGYPSGALHGDMNQRQRTRTIDQLRRGSIDILVATDVAARGIDVSTLSHVINFDLPPQPEDFVHRIGRTGRAGAKGIAISFASQRDSFLLSRILKLTGNPMATLTVPGLEPKSRTMKPGGAPGGHGGGMRRDGRPPQRKRFSDSGPRSAPRSRW
jgi:superfamily II DNA/RNA helicase